jgi:hypothetical protein
MSGKMFNAAEVERIVESIGESEQLLAKTHLGRTLAEASAPEGILEVRRAWREVDAVIGPGKSAMDVMLARYRSLSGVSERMNELLRQGRRARSATARRFLLAEMDTELKAFRKFKSEIADRVEQSVDEIRNRLTADFSEEFTRGRKTITRREAKAECIDALDEFELALQNQREAIERRIAGTPTAAQAEKRAESMVTRLEETSQTGERAIISYRVKRFAQHPNAQELSAEFAKGLKRRLRRDFPAIHDIDDSALVFMEALGAIESARPDVARLLRRYAEGGAASLSKKELEKVGGILGHLRGLMPEEVALRMGFCDALFHKAAFELLADIPPELRNQLSVEIVEGPMWVVRSSGAPLQFGDGAMLITGPEGQSAIVGLGEVKAGFDEDLVEQLLSRSDKRAIDAKVTFLDREGNTQMRQLTRQFKLRGPTEPVALTKPPIYVHSSPAGQGVEAAADFQHMLDEQLRSGRELLKVQLPFGVAENNRCTEAMLKEGVKTMKKIRPSWGK